VVVVVAAIRDDQEVLVAAVQEVQGLRVRNREQLTLAAAAAATVVAEQLAAADLGLL
jgi:hypothetical protein